MIHFYGSPMSSAGRTHWMLEETGQPYEYHRVNVRAGDTKKPEFLAINPAGTVPAIDDDGFCLAESIAVNFYLADRYRSELLGKTPGERGLVFQWSLWAITNLQPELLTIMSHLFLLPEAERSPRAAEGAKARVLPLLAVLERALTGKEFIACDRFTVADVNLASVVNLAPMLGVLGPESAGVSAYLARMKARPAYQKAASAG